MANEHEDDWEVKRRSVMMRTDPSMQEFIRKFKNWAEVNEERRIENDVQASKLLAEKYAIHPGMTFEEAMQRMGRFKIKR